MPLPALLASRFKAVRLRQNLVHDCGYPIAAVGRRPSMSRSDRRKLRRAKVKLGLPDLEQAKAAVLVSVRSPESQRSYRHSIDEFVLWSCPETECPGSRLLAHSRGCNWKGKRSHRDWQVTFSASHSAHCSTTHTRLARARNGSGGQIHRPLLDRATHHTSSSSSTRSELPRGDVVHERRVRRCRCRRWCT